MEFNDQLQSGETLRKTRNPSICHFDFRSALWIEEDKDCSLLGVDRHVMAGTTTFQPSEGTDYLERNCVVGEPRRLCIYDRVKGKILKTVDSVYQAIDSREDCEDLCNTAPFRYIFRNFLKWF